MRDLKYLTKPRKSRFQRYWKDIALITVLVLLLVPATLLVVRKGAQAVSSWQESRQKPVQKVQPIQLGDNLFAAADALLSSAAPGENGMAVTAPDGTVLNLTINPALQQRVQQFLNSARPSYAVFVALEPATGRVLSLAGYSAHDTAWRQQAAYQTYPMASLFKMVTATAALEQQKISPDTVLAFRGNLVSENPRHWDPSPRGRNNQMDLTLAMGKSVNPVYGLIASELVGKEQLQHVCSRFGFNRSLLLPGVPALPSPAPLPENRDKLRLQGCGLDHDLQISPMHAAAITAAIANRGALMTPRLVDRAERNGKELKVPKPEMLYQITSPETADSLTRMLLTTVTSGTSRRAFRTHEGLRLIKNMKIAAKTGSINGDNPKGYYSWFAAFAPADAPRIALVALVINGEKWKIKASNLGEQALTAYFGS